MTIAPYGTAFVRGVADDYIALLLMQAILDNGGTVVSVTANPEPRGTSSEALFVFAVLPSASSYKLVDDAFSKRLNEMRA